MESLDFLHSSIDLYIKGKSGFKTSMGGFFTIFLIIFSTGAFFAFGLDIFFKKNPKIVEVLKNNPDPYYKITPQSIAFTIYDQETANQFNELDRKFETYLEVFKVIGTKVKKEKHFFCNCTPENMPYFNKSIYYPENKYFCLRNNTNIDIYGAFNTYNFSQARIQVDFCRNNSNINYGPVKQNCYPQNFIKKNITERIQMHILMKSIGVTNNDFEKPGSDLVITKMLNTDVNTWSRMHVFFRNILICTDKGWIFTQDEDLKFESVHHIMTESIYNKKTDTLFSHIFANGKELKIHYRTYIKVQDVFALMGGFISLFISFSKFFLRFFNQPKIVDLFNKIYRLDDIEYSKDVYYRNDFSKNGNVHKFDKFGNLSRRNLDKDFDKDIKEKEIDGIVNSKFL